MRIHHVITRLVAGGAQQNTLLCAAQQAGQGHEVTVISGIETGPEGSLLEQARAGPYHFREIPALVREIDPIRDLKALAALVGYFARQRPDICHTHTSKAGILGRLAARICGVPVIVHTPHGHVFHSYFSRVKSEIFKYCERFLGLIATDAMVLLTREELREHLEERIVPAGLCYVIPSGVDVSVFGGFHGPQTGQRPVLGYVGRLADIKGPLDLVEALALVVRDIPEADLLMVGDGPLRSEVEKAVERLGLNGRVHITGWQSDVGPFLQQMDLLVVPSHNEGMGRVVVEAMAAGLPVIATAVGGLVDLVRDESNGYLANPRDPASLAEKVVKMLRLPDRGRALGVRGREVAHEFSLQVMFERMDLLYERLATLKGISYS